MAVEVDDQTIEQLEEELDKPIPCEVKKCLTNHIQPATWFFTHDGAAAVCTKMLCGACKRSADRVCAKAELAGHGEVLCPGCHCAIKTTALIFRPL